jgi:hypothetical protein
VKKESVHLRREVLPDCQSRRLDIDRELWGCHTLSNRNINCTVNALVNINLACSAGDISLVKKSARLEDPLYHTILNVPLLTLVPCPVIATVNVLGFSVHV